MIIFQGHNIMEFLGCFKRNIIAGNVRKVQSIRTGSMFKMLYGAGPIGYDFSGVFAI